MEYGFLLIKVGSKETTGADYIKISSSLPYSISKIEQTDRETKYSFYNEHPNWKTSSTREWVFGCVHEYTYCKYTTIKLERSFGAVHMWVFLQMYLIQFYAGILMTLTNTYVH